MARQEPVPNYLSALGLRWDCTREDAKRAYRDLAQQLHPDRGGDGGQFRHLRTHYERALQHIEQRETQAAARARAEAPPNRVVRRRRRQSAPPVSRVRPRGLRLYYLFFLLGPWLLALLVPLSPTWHIALVLPGIFWIIIGVIPWWLGRWRPPISGFLATSMVAILASMAFSTAVGGGPRFLQQTLRVVRGETECTGDDILVLGGIAAYVLMTCASILGWIFSITSRDRRYS